MNNDSSSTGIIVGVLIVIVILVVGWFAYRQGLFTGSQNNQNNNEQTPSNLEIQVNTPGGNTPSGGTNGGSSGGTGGTGGTGIY